MTNKLVRAVTKTYIAGTPSVAPQPARCYTRTTTVQTSGSVGGGSLVFVPLSEVNTGTLYAGFIRPVFRSVEPYTGEFGQLVTQELIGYTAMRHSPDPTYQPSYTTRTETICTPAVPGVEGTPPEIILQNAGPDWQASSRSIGVLGGGVTASFDMNPSPRAIVGLATRDTGSNQSDIRMGVAFVTAGVTTTVSPVLDGVVQASVGTYTAGDHIVLVRVSGKFYIQVGGTTVYSAAATTEDDVFLDAMLYTSADYVDNPELGPAESTSIRSSFGFSAGLSTRTGIDGAVGYRSAIGTAVDGVVLVPVTGSVGFTGTTDGKATQQVSVAGAVGFNKAIRSGVYFLKDGVLMGVDNSDLSGATLAVASFEVLGSDKAYASAQIELQPFVIAGNGGQLSQSVAGGDLVLAPMLSYSSMLSGGVGEAELELKPLTTLAADRPYGAGQFTLPRLFTYGDDGFGIPNYYGHNDSLRISDTLFTDPSLFASIYETLELEPSMSLATLVSGTVLEGLLLDPTLSVKDFLTALIESGINLSSATQMPDPAVAQYAFNALTGAATRYSDFGFTQFTRVGGETYAIKPDGLYRLRSGDDNGSRRSALVDFGTMSFGAQQRKNIETMYLGMTTDGTVYAKLKADGGSEKLYRVIQREPTMRVRTGKGITAREWDLKLEVVNATRVDLDNVDFVVGASVRRWTR